MKKKIFLYSGVGIIIIAVAVYFLFFSSDSAEIKYRTEKVTRGDVTIQVRATGTINPVQTVQVGSQVSGIIDKLYADFNSEVKQGQIIARIDSTFLYASVKEAEANLERNQAQVNEAKRSFNRTTELFKKNLVSQADLDAAQTQFEAATAQLKQSQASLDRVMVNLRYSIIRAPIDGVVISREIDVGQTVAASFQAPKLFTIANDLKQMQVEASVDEADIGQIKEDQVATFTVDAYPGEEFEGEVTQVRLSPVTVQNVVTYTVIIHVPNADLKLRPGMTATVSILIDKRENVLRVPTLAIRFQPPQEVLAKMKNEGKPETGDKIITEAKPEQKSPENQVGEQRMREFRQGNPSGEQKSERGRPEKMERRKFRSGDDSLNQDGSMTRKHFKPKTAKVWILEKGKDLKSIEVRTGINDNRFVEIMTDELKDGDEIIIGTTNGATAMGSQQTNPFAPRTIGGSGSGMGRRGP
ncbi:MAG: efflux RND transporter periplasmic adaptor subunit [Chlorobiaceae bacterium]|nr:efflux RND transporter periplasmic adaptor subunit [Chlorobiaceae bacterium]